MKTQTQEIAALKARIFELENELAGWQASHRYLPDAQRGVSVSNMPCKKTGFHAYGDTAGTFTYIKEESQCGLLRSLQRY